MIKLFHGHCGTLRGLKTIAVAPSSSSLDQLGDQVHRPSSFLDWSAPTGTAPDWKGFPEHSVNGSPRIKTTRRYESNGRPGDAHQGRLMLFGFSRPLNDVFQPPQS